MPRIVDNLAHLERRPFSLAEAFAADGIVPPRWDRPPSQRYFEDRRFLYRIDHHTARPTVQVAVRSCFNKWGDSVDFQFSAPGTLRAYRKRMRRLSRAYGSGRYCRGWGLGTWI
jgi:hypothetical protein